MGRLHETQAAAVAAAVALQTVRPRCRLVYALALGVLAVTSPIAIDTLLPGDQTWELLLGPLTLAAAAAAMLWCAVRTLHELRSAATVTARRTRLRLADAGGLRGTAQLPAGIPDARWNDLPIVAYVGEVGPQVRVLLAIDLDPGAVLDAA